MSKTIAKHPLVKMVEPVDSDTPDYKWFVQLIEGHRFCGYHAHVKNVKSVAEFNRLSTEPCPAGCDCGKGK
jgi:hypothetical protein